MLIFRGVENLDAFAGESIARRIGEDQTAGAGQPAPDPLGPRTTPPEIRV